MSVPTITLTGRAVNGVEPHLISPHVLSALPPTVRLGRKRVAAHPPVLRLSAFLDRASVNVPASTNYREKAAPSLARMYLNDRYGCCVISGKGHALGVWSANDADSGGIVQATDQEILSQYHGICGPGDNGCVITQVLDVMRSKGFTAGGKQYRIDGYVSADWTNKLEVQVAQYAFGACTIGINLPRAWTGDDVWDVPSGSGAQIVGGHDVTPLDYDERGVYVASWGRVYLITWAAWLNARKTWVEEYYVLLAPLWYGSDKLAPCGVNATALAAALSQLGGGIIPDVGPVTPPSPPQPPEPPVPPQPPTPPVVKPLFRVHYPAVKKGKRTPTYLAPVDLADAWYDVSLSTSRSAAPHDPPEIDAKK